jgi:hypothetical protein
MRSAPPPSSPPMLLRLRLLLLSELAPPASISTEGDSRVCFRSRRIAVEGAREHGAIGSKVWPELGTGGGAAGWTAAWPGGLGAGV